MALWHSVCLFYRTLSSSNLPSVFLSPRLLFFFPPVGLLIRFLLVPWLFFGLFRLDGPVCYYGFNPFVTLPLLPAVIFFFFFFSSLCGGDPVAWRRFSGRVVDPFVPCGSASWLFVGCCGLFQVLVMAFRRMRSLGSIYDDFFWVPRCAFAVHQHFLVFQPPCSFLGFFEHPQGPPRQ